MPITQSDSAPAASCASATAPEPPERPLDDAAWSACLAIRRLSRSQWPSAAAAFKLNEEGEALVHCEREHATIAWTHATGWHWVGAAAASEALELFPLYKPLLDRPPQDPPWLIAQLGQSLDGCVATANGDSCFVNGPDTLTHLHRLRALCDAVLVGAGTVASDDPQLTTRRVRGDHPVRVVLDPMRRLPPTARVFNDGLAPTLHLIDRAVAGELPAPGAASARGFERVAVPGLAAHDGGVDAAAAVSALAARGLTRLFLEGGGITVSRFLMQGCIDRLHLAIAPVLIGAGRRGLQLPGSASMAECLRPPCRVFRLGSDLLWDMDLAAARGSPCAPGAGISAGR